MHNQGQRSDSAAEALEGGSGGAASEPTTTAGTTLPATGSLSRDAGTSWDPWEIWHRCIEQPRRRRRVATKRQR